jgi:insulysin
MLFLGTEKTPEEGAFRKLIKRHAGGTNAWTSTDMTTYYFTCANGGFLEALSEWLWFFVAPTMTESALEREVQAVHSECEKYHTHPVHDGSHWGADVRRAGPTVLCVRRRLRRRGIESL